MGDLELKSDLFDKKEMPPLIKSVYDNQDTILQAIIELYIPAGKIQVDPCFNKGGFYRSGKIQLPQYCYDIDPQKQYCDYLEKQDCRDLPLDTRSINSIIFDPPFLTYEGRTAINKMHKNYGRQFRTWNDLKTMYCEAFEEFYRILKPGGILIVKCQDETIGANYIFTLGDAVIDPCRVIGFKLLDIFILVSKARIERRDQGQKHARKYHCYFVVMRKKK